MKYRNGFVSNSSSSSFVCEICGEVAAGMDISLPDFDMGQCEIGHIVCFEHINKQKQSQVEIRLGQDNKEIDWWEFPKKMCPMCLLENLSKDDELAYYRYKYNMTPDSTLREIRSEYKDYEIFTKTITERK